MHRVSVSSWQGPPPSHHLGQLQQQQAGGAVADPRPGPASGSSGAVTWPIGSSISRSTGSLSHDSSDRPIGSSSRAGMGGLSHDSSDPLARSSANRMAARAGVVAAAVALGSVVAERRSISGSGNSGSSAAGSPLRAAGKREGAAAADSVHAAAAATRAPRQVQAVAGQAQGQARVQAATAPAQARVQAQALTRLITSCSSWQALQALCLRHCADLDFIHLSAAYVKVCKLGPGTGGEQPQQQHAPSAPTTPAGTSGSSTSGGSSSGSSASGSSTRQQQQGSASNGSGNSSSGAGGTSGGSVGGAGPPAGGGVPWSPRGSHASFLLLLLDQLWTVSDLLRPRELANLLWATSKVLAEAPPSSRQGGEEPGHPGLRRAGARTGAPGRGGAGGEGPDLAKGAAAVLGPDLDPGGDLGLLQSHFAALLGLIMPHLSSLNPQVS